MGTFSFWHFLGKLKADLWHVFIWKDTIFRGNATKGCFPPIAIVAVRPSVRPSGRPSGRPSVTAMSNAYSNGTVAAGKTVLSPFDRVRSGDFPCQTAST